MSGLLAVRYLLYVSVLLECCLLCATYYECAACCALLTVSVLLAVRYLLCAGEEARG